VLRLAADPSGAAALRDRGLGAGAAAQNQEVGLPAPEGGGIHPALAAEPREGAAARPTWGASRGRVLAVLAVLVGLVGRAGAHSALDSCAFAACPGACPEGPEEDRAAREDRPGVDLGASVGAAAAEVLDNPAAHAWGVARQGP
jgi:hypothetical protein